MFVNIGGHMDLSADPQFNRTLNFGQYTEDATGKDWI